MQPARPSFICASCTRALRSHAKPQSVRQFTASPTSEAKASISNSTPSEPPRRWEQTPPAMKMPFRLRQEPNQPVWRVNTDEEKLNKAYDRFLVEVAGNTRGRDLLDRETKWLAITHKSFDHARRGFNDRLAFLGKRIIDLQTSLALLSAPIPPHLQDLPWKDVYRHQALEGVDNVSPFAKLQVLDKSRLASLAASHGLDKVIRWKPKKAGNLHASGLDVVLAHTIYSIVGALALQHGGEVAAKTARERVLRPLGL